MPATTTYNEIYTQFKRDIGLSADFGANTELDEMFNGWFNDRLREIWRASNWRQTMSVEPLIVCSDGVALLPCIVDAGDKVQLYKDDPRSDFAPKKQDFILNDGWLWVSTGIKPKKIIDEYDGIALSGKLFSNLKTCSLSKGDMYVERIWNANFAFTCKYYIYNGVDGVFYEGAEIDGNSDFVEMSYLPFEPNLYLYYKAIAPQFDLNGKDIFTELELGIPLFMKRYVQLAIHSDWLRSQNRHEESAGVFANAERVKEEEIYKFESFSVTNRGGYDG